MQKFSEDNLSFIGNTVQYNASGAILALTTNNGFIYAGGQTVQTVQKFQEAGESAEQIPTFSIQSLKEE